MLYKLKKSKLFDESQRQRDDDDDCPFAVHRMHLCVDSRLLCVAGNSHVALFNFSKLDASVDCPVSCHLIITTLLPKVIWEDLGQIKVCGGPRLDTFTGPYPSFYLLSSPTRALSVWGIIPGKN